MSMNVTVRSVLLMVVASMAIAVACGTATASEFSYNPDPHETAWTSQSAPEHTDPIEPSPYLVDPIAPCTPIENGTVDPCERRLYDWWCCEIYLYRSPAPWWPPDIPWDAYEKLSITNGAAYHHAFSVVRATVIPDSTRCIPVSGWLFSTVKTRTATPKYVPEPVQENCFVDVRVNEYYFARGPKELTLLLDRQQSWTHDFDSVSEHREFLVKQFAQFEGYEFVLELIAPGNLLVRTWRVGSAWDVQRKSDGSVVAVDRLAKAYADSPEWLHKVELPLSELREQVRRANDEKLAKYDGRVGEGSNLPSVIHDIGDASLMRWMLDQDAWTLSVDATPMAPPPAPGEDDLFNPGFNVLEITVTASPEVPGGLEDTPTPVSALGDEPTATATVEPSATATAEATVESTVTPEPAPTPEQEDTPTPEPEVAPTANPEPVPTPEPEPTATPEPVVEPTATPEPVVEPTATPEPAPVVEPTATATPEPEPVIEPTATPEDAVATDTPEPEVPGPEGPGAVGEPGDEDGPDGPDTGSGPDG